MGFFWGLSHRLQYAAAIIVAITLAFPVVCAMFAVLTFGLGMLWLVGVIAIVFGTPIWLFVQKPTAANREKRARRWHAWSLCLIVHVGASAGICRMMDHMPMSQFSSKGRSFVTDYLGTLFAPVSIVWVLANRQSANPAEDPREFRPG